VSVKVFVTSNQMATFSCPQCGESQLKDVSKFFAHESQVRLKYKCKCHNSFSIILERRRSTRKDVNLKGSLIEKQQKSPITIIDISKHGIKIKILKKHTLTMGEKLEIEFILDDPNRSIVSKAVRINKIIPPMTISCEFIDFNHYGNLGKYFLYHF